jgi:hypothetical protein
MLMWMLELSGRCNYGENILKYVPINRLLGMVLALSHLKFLEFWQKKFLHRGTIVPRPKLQAEQSSAKICPKNPQGALKCLPDD